MKKHILLSTLLAGALSIPAVSGEVLSEEELEEVSAKGIQIIINDEDLDDEQFNNNGSLQLANEAQQDIENVVVNNNAQSADNTGVNLLGNLSTSGDIVATQTNDQYADNYVDYTDQYVYTEDDVDDEQFNNNASVQLINEAQENANAVAAVNSAQSASNLGLNAVGNLATATSITTTQTNDQTAYNNVY